LTFPFYYYFFFKIHIDQKSWTWAGSNLFTMAPVTKMYSFFMILNPNGCQDKSPITAILARATWTKKNDRVSNTLLRRNESIGTSIDPADLDRENYRIPW